MSHCVTSNTFKNSSHFSHRMLHGFALVSFKYTNRHLEEEEKKKQCVGGGERERERGHVIFSALATTPNSATVCHLGFRKRAEQGADDFGSRFPPRCSGEK